MSSRQKCFGEQDHGNKARQKWQGNRSFDETTTPVGSMATKPAPPGSPIHAYSQPQPKHKAVRQPNGRPGSQTRDPDKENKTCGVPVSTKSPSPEKDGKDLEPAKTPAMAQSKALPSTPAMRLPLADLIGNAEEALRRPTPKEEQPEEHIGWIANSSHPDLSPQRRRKRAHSSSPITASQKDSVERLAVRDPLDLQNLNHVFKTPHADPAADLWSRYAIGRNADETSLQLGMPSFAHLIEDSSPRSGPRTPGGSVGGLRRWASCGLEWPASKAKRRRTNGVFRDRQSNVFGSGGDDSQSSDEPKTKQLSRVSMLVEQVQESLAKPSLNLRPDAPSSSSPLPDKGDLERFPAKPHDMANAWSRQGSQGGRLSQSSNRQNLSQKSRGADLSEFGDEDLDLDMMEDLQPGPILNNSVYPDAQTGQRSPSSKGAGCSHQSGGRPPLDTIDEDSDEFGDDIDITADDIENSVPIYNTQPVPVTPVSKKDSGGSTSRNQRKVPVTLASHAEQPATTRPVIQCPQQVHDLAGFSDDDDDEFGGSDLDDEQFAEAEIAATQAYQASAANLSSRTQKSRTIQRYLVKQVIDGQYADERGKLLSETVLLVEDETAKRSKVIILHQSWTDTHCTAGSYVHVVGSFDRAGQITINDAENMIIVHPDHLISATVVADSFECIRRAVLQDRVKATSRKNEPNVYGSILHEVFQEALKTNSWDAQSLNTIVDKTVTRFLESLFEIGHENTNKATEHLKSKLPELQSWATTFVKARPGPDALADDRNGKKILLSITKLLDVEEHVWSPTYGLKGNIDATVQTVMRDENGERNLTVPFEVKTGRNTSNSSHRAQTALYTLLLSDRYDIEIIYGVLYYMENSAITRIPAIRNELRHMVMQRNELACYVRERLQLPPMLQNPHKCGRCYAKTQCFLYHKLAENGTSESAGVKEKFEELVGKLRPAHQEFFKKWDDLLTKEESEMMKFRRELWTMLSTERQKLGRCFSEVVIEAGSRHENEDAAKINRFSYTFVKKETSSGFSFTESQITVGEPIVVSSEQGHFALANGYVTKVSSRRITVAVDRRLHNARKKQPGFNSQTNQTFAGIMEVGKEDQSSPADDPEDDTLYRVDKDEFSNGMATVRNNLLAIMDDSVYRSAELRSLIVEDSAPVFKPVPTAYSLSGSASQLQVNSDQRAAIDKVMSAKDYALVLGMPGTGKTTTIAHIIRALVARGKSVLLTSYTHTAVDNILLKLRHSEISILRLGSIAKIHPEVQAFANLAATPKDSLEEINECYMTPQVVATTCLGVNHQLFHRRVFDYCIVDEASQITLPVCLGPIRMARTFVLVGDHYQLPPLVQNRDAAEGGLDVSLFKLLSDRRPESVVNLEHQYRMCEDIMLLSSTLIYSGRLKCGNQAVAQRTLELPHPDGISRYHNTASSSWAESEHMCPSLTSAACWLSKSISPARKVLFLNTDTLSPMPRETAHGSRIVNSIEAQLMTQLVLSLVSSGVPAHEIGVIAFYRSQLALLRQTLKRYPETHGIEMHTADKFQGRDKEVVLVSCVRSNESGNVGDLLRDWRRINVAFTRARSKLLVLGSRGTLAQNELLDTFIQLMDSRGWVLNLPQAAERAHDFELLASAATNTQRTPGRPSPKVVNRPQGRKPLRQARVNGTLENKGLVGLGIKSGMKPFKIPEKVGIVGQRALLKKGTVLMDIVNDALGDENVEA
ncbi:hypothetical protein MBLNU459_g7017t2 [Dothideomycetes sp. NU459]